MEFVNVNYNILVIFWRVEYMVRIKNNIKLELEGKVMHLEFIKPGTNLEFTYVPDTGLSISRLIEAHLPKYLIFNMGNIAFLDSAAIGMFIAIINKLGVNNVFFYDISERCQRILGMVKMDNFIYPHKDLETVIAIISDREGL